MYKSIQPSTPEELPHARFFKADELAHSWCQPLNEPVWTTAYGHLRDDDPVLGVYLNRQARAMPWWILKNHHVANVAFGDMPVLVTLCEMCSGAAAFRAEAEGRRLNFRLRGQYNGTILLDDTTTHSQWSPFTGVALAGVMRGATLERLPLLQCLWSEWLEMHPTTEVLYGEQALREGHGSQFSPGSAGIGPGFLKSLLRPLDERLPHNTLVLGVENGASARAYPLETLARIGPVLNDSLAGADLVVVPARDAAGARLPPPGPGPRVGFRPLRNGRRVRPADGVGVERDGRGGLGATRRNTARVSQIWS